MLVKNLKNLFKGSFFVISTSYLINFYYPRHSINEKIRPYANEFLSVVQEHCSVYQYHGLDGGVIEFSKLESPKIGICYNHITFYNVKIDEAYFNVSTEKTRFQLIAHELSHCMFGIDHIIDYNHYMNPVLNEDLEKDVVKKQVAEILIKRCGR